MAISKAYQRNFQTLLDAAKNGDLCLMECTDAETGRPVMTVCAVNVVQDPTMSEPQYQMVPIAKMFDGNPYEEVMPPMDAPNATNTGVLQ